MTDENIKAESRDDLNTVVKKKIGKLLKLYGFERVTIMRADGSIEEVVSE